MTVGRVDLVARLADAAQVDGAIAAEIVAAWEKVLVEAVASGEAVRLPGLLSIDLVDRAERQGRNPRTGEALTIAARKAVRVSPGSRLKAAVSSSL